MYHPLPLLAFVSLTASAASAAEGHLGQVREQVRSGAPATSSAPASRTASMCSSDHADGDGVLGSLVHLVFGGGDEAVACRDEHAERPYRWAGDDRDRERAGSRPREPASPPTRRTFAQAEYGMRDADLLRIGARARWDAEPPFGCEASWDRFYESSGRLPSTGTGWDRLDLIEADAVYRLCMSEHASLRGGLGARAMHDAHGTDYGFSAVLGFDALVAGPMRLTVDLALGTLGHASLVRIRGDLGVGIGSFEPYAGYEYLDIGGVELQGPYAGVRVHF